MATILQYERSKLPSELSSTGINAELARKISDSYQQMKVYAKNDAQAAEWLMRDSKKVFGVEIKDKGILDAALAYVGKTQGNIASERYIAEQRAKNLESISDEHKSMHSASNSFSIGREPYQKSAEVYRRTGTDDRLPADYFSHPERGAIRLPTKQDLRKVPGATLKGVRKLSVGVTKYVLLPIAGLGVLGYAILRYSPATEQRLMNYITNGTKGKIEDYLNPKYQAQSKAIIQEFQKKYNDLQTQLEAEKRAREDNDKALQEALQGQIIQTKKDLEDLVKQIQKPSVQTRQPAASSITTQQSTQGTAQQVQSGQQQTARRKVYNRAGEWHKKYLDEEIGYAQLPPEGQLWFGSQPIKVEFKEDGSNYTLIITENQSYRGKDLAEHKFRVYLADGSKIENLVLNQPNVVTLPKNQYESLKSMQKPWTQVEVYKPEQDQRGLLDRIVSSFKRIYGGRIKKTEPTPVVELKPTVHEPEKIKTEVPPGPARGVFELDDLKAQ